VHACQISPPSGGVQFRFGLSLNIQKDLLEKSILSHRRAANGNKIKPFVISNPSECSWVNSMRDLSQAEALARLLC
jgi:hypothetical protein